MDGAPGLSVCHPMRYGKTLITGPTVEPVSLAEAKAHLRVDHGDDDTLIGAQITAARRWCEAYTERAFLTQTWDIGYDRFPCGDSFVVPMPPLQSVTSITYKDASGATQTLDSSKYVVDTGREPARIALAYGQTWPITYDEINAVTVRIVAGYGDEASDVPEEVRAAMKLLLTSLYDYRAPFVTGTIVAKVEFNVQSLLSAVAVWEVC